MKNKNMNIQTSTLKHISHEGKIDNAVIKSVNHTAHFPDASKIQKTEKQTAIDKAWERFLKHAGAGSGPGDLSYNHDAYDTL